MVYSLTDASALGLDLARTPGGVEAAGVLLRGLLGAAPGGGGSDGAGRDGDTPAGAVPDRPVRGPADLQGARARALALLGPATPTVVDLTAAECDEPHEPGPGEDLLAPTLRRIMRRLGSVSFGTVGDLLTLAASLPRPVLATAPGLALTTEADLGEVLADAVLAALVRHRADPAAPVLARALAHRLDPPSPGRPALPVLAPPGHALLAASSPVDGDVVTGTATLLARLATVADPAALEPAHRPAPQVWAHHMHEAAWAVEATGRTRLAAAAQLELLRCLDAAGVEEARHLAGVWNWCSAAVQAHVVADVLGADPTTVLAGDLLDRLDRLDGLNRLDRRG